MGAVPAWRYTSLQGTHEATTLAVAEAQRIAAFLIQYTDKNLDLSIHCY
jgi:hypothetical protein